MEAAPKRTTATRRARALVPGLVLAALMTAGLAVHPAAAQDRGHEREHYDSRRVVVVTPHHRRRYVAPPPVYYAPPPPVYYAPAPRPGPSIDFIIPLFR